MLTMLTVVENKWAPSKLILGNAWGVNTTLPVCDKDYLRIALVIAARNTIIITLQSLTRIAL